jgi:ADP-heptose:LPS heptosyltransferase
MAKLRGNRLLRRLDTWGGRPTVLAMVPFSRRAVPIPAAPERILVVKLPSIGDTILLAPTLRALRERFHTAHVGLVGTAGNAGLAERLPWVDEVFTLDPNRAVREPSYFASFVRAVRRGRWQVGLDFEQWTYVSPLLLRLAGVPVRVGFRTPDRVRHLLYTHTRPRRRESHESQNFYSLLEPLGIAGPAGAPELPVAPALVAAARQRTCAAGWNGSDPLVMVHPGCGHAHARAWPLERYAAVCRQIAAERPVFFACTGAGSDAGAAEALAARLPGAASAFTTLSIPEFTGQVAVADLVVSGNTGAMHVAAALRLPQLVLEGPNDPAKWGPLNPDAHILRSSCPGCPCLDFGWEFHRTDGFCMEQIGEEEVLDALRRMLDSVKAGATASGRALP